MSTGSSQPQLTINSSSAHFRSHISSFPLDAMRLNNSVTNWSSLPATMSQAIRKKAQSLIQTVSILQTDDPATSETSSVRSLTARKRPQYFRRSLCRVVPGRLCPQMITITLTILHRTNGRGQTMKIDCTTPLAAF